ncbi:hypothetical protein EV368DRAFT_80788 [Lentinula lateritia]|nr:hypothetical protein EV368DRAFT_80788 [Lentinula lateritia]
MASYRDLLAGLKDEILPSSAHSNSRPTSLTEARTRASAEKYKNLSLNDEMDYGLRVMAVGMSSDAPPSRPSHSLLSPDAQGRLQFGDPKQRHKRTTQALTTISAITEATRGLKAQIEAISSSHTSAEINTILCTVEDNSDALRHHISSVTRTAVSEEVKEARAMLDLLDQVVSVWRTNYPDSSPVKIDNRKYFFDPGEAQRGASLTLKLLKLFGYFMAVLGNQELNPEQEATLAAIPESIETLEQKFNLDIDCITYSVCPKCSYTHPPSYPNDASHPVYPTVCLERKALSEEPCGTSLLLHRKPVKTFEYYPFFDWFGKFLSLPGIEEYGDRFCDVVSSHQTIPVDKVDETDGRFVHEFCAQDGKMFVAERGEEGRWFFILNADFFNAEGNRIRGKTSSTGMLAMTCLNLPLQI